jgi:hypothetical protein
MSAYEHCSHKFVITEKSKPKNLTSSKIKVSMKRNVGNKINNSLKTSILKFIFNFI